MLNHDPVGDARRILAELNRAGKLPNHRSDRAALKRHLTRKFAWDVPDPISGYGPYFRAIREIREELDIQPETPEEWRGAPDPTTMTREQYMAAMGPRPGTFTFSKKVITDIGELEWIEANDDWSGVS